jgi:DNA invertase Pin-like site-specific DNA recombinase
MDRRTRDTRPFADFERSMLQARIHARLRKAVANGRKLGRPLNDPAAVARAKLALGNGIGINRGAKLVGLSNGTVQRIKMEMAMERAEKATSAVQLGEPA